MTDLLAFSRPEFPLFVHVLGAMVLVGAVTTAVVAQLVPGIGSVDGDRMRRFSFRTLLLAALPAYIVMRIGAEWMYSKEFDSNSDDPTWIGIGYITADIGALLLLIALITAGIASLEVEEPAREGLRHRRGDRAGGLDRRRLGDERQALAGTRSATAYASRPKRTSRASATSVSAPRSAVSACRTASSNGQP